MHKSGSVALALFATLAASPAANAANAANAMVDADGARYRVQANGHGAVLHGGEGPVYLGRDCDAWSKRGGRGRWHWANGGVVVELERGRIAFPRQEPAFDDGGRCRA